MELGGNAFILNESVANKIKYGGKDGKSRGVAFMETVNYAYDLEVPMGSRLIEESSDSETYEGITPVYVSKINMGRMVVVFLSQTALMKKWKLAWRK